MRAMTFGLIAVLLLNLRPFPAGGAELGRTTPSDSPTAVAEALEGVVRLRVRAMAPVPVFRGGRFHHEVIEGTGAGSGVVVSRRGLILTNAHVIDGGSDVLVTTTTGSNLLGQVIAIDHASDLALVRVPGAPLRPVPFAAGAPPAAGQKVFVIGNRDDAGMEVLTGRIGNRQRVRAGVRPLEFWTELDAPVGPGDSGGAVIDAAGRLIGMVTLQTGYARGVEITTRRTGGLFIPVRHLHRALSRMIGAGCPQWAWIGLILDDPILAAGDGRAWDTHQAPRVRSVAPQSPALRAGFRPGDRILSIGDRPVADNAEALELVIDLAPGDPVDVTIDRAGRRLTIPVITAVRPEDPRPEPLDDFRLHTGLKVAAPKRSGQGLALAGMMPGLLDRAPRFEADVFAGSPTLRSLLPGRDLLAGVTHKRPVHSVGDLSAMVPDCFVGEQFVALIHWDAEVHTGVDRAYVHRKVYPVVL